MARIRAPIVPEQPVPVVPEDGLRRLLAACAGKGFDARRDTAMVMLLVDAGPRVGELAGMRVAEVDFDLEVVGVLGKGRRERALPFGRRTAVALDRYLRGRERHRDAEAPWLWLGQRGQLTRWGVGKMLERRAAQARIPDLHPHQLRHTFCHEWLAQGGGETDLIRLAGWKSRDMLGRYGASAADARNDVGVSASWPCATRLPGTRRGPVRIPGPPAPESPEPGRGGRRRGGDIPAA